MIIGAGIGVLLILATLVFLSGTIYRIVRYWRTPVPFKMPIAPAPMTRFGVVLRLLREVFLFESLFKATRWTWVFGWVFHFSLLIVVITHLKYFTDPVWGWVIWLVPFGHYAALAMMISLTGLLVRRLAVSRVRFISSPSDYLMLLLLLAIGGSGLLMSRVFVPDILALRQFALGLPFQLSPLPGHALLILHLLLVVSLLLIFPYSKLLHAPGLFFSPARNQVDDARQRRHDGGWQLRRQLRNKNS